MTNDTTNEQLSALVDGELPRDELRFLLRRLDNDGELARRWSRYQLVSAVFRHEAMPLDGGGRFAAAVMARLDGGAAAAAPVRFGSRLLRWAGGGAIAASVAIAALILTRPAVDNPAAGPAGNPVAAAPTSQPATPVAELHALPARALPQLLPAFSEITQPASFESIVPSYAPRYPAGQVANGVSEGFVPYVLVVGSRQMLEPQPGGKPDSAAKQ